MTANYYIIPGIKRALIAPEQRGARVTTFEDVLKVVAIYTGITQDAIRKKGRKREVIFARHLVCYMARKKTPLSLKAIGGEFGQDHTTVINGVGKIEGYLDIKDPDTVTAVDAIQWALR